MTNLSAHDRRAPEELKLPVRPDANGPRDGAAARLGQVDRHTAAVLFAFPASRPMRRLVTNCILTFGAPCAILAATLLERGPAEGGKWIPVIP